MSKRDAAYILYLNGWSHKQIANLVDMSPDTVARWSSKYGWKNKKNEKGLLEQTSRERILSLIDYQLKIIEKITHINSQKLAGKLDVSQLQSILISKGDIDALTKLASTIKGKEMSWDNMVKITKEILDFIESENLTLAKRISPFLREWLNHKRENL